MIRVIILMIDAMPVASLPPIISSTFVSVVISSYQITNRAIFVCMLNAVP